MDGGIICPSVPDAHTVPAARVCEYLCRNIAGSEISPIAMTVAPTMPVVAASNAPTKTTEIPSPPGIGPNNCAIVTNRSSAMRERCNMMPMKTNSGMAISVSRSTSQYRLRKLVTPALNHCTGPPCEKYASMSPAKIHPHSAANPIVKIAEPGRENATGNPELKAPTIRRKSTARNRSSIITPQRPRFLRHCLSHDPQTTWARLEDRRRFPGNNS